MRTYGKREGKKERKSERKREVYLAETRKKEEIRGGGRMESSAKRADGERVLSVVDQLNP